MTFKMYPDKTWNDIVSYFGIIEDKASDLNSNIKCIGDSRRIAILRRNDRQKVQQYYHKHKLPRESAGGKRRALKTGFDDINELK